MKIQLKSLLICTYEIRAISTVDCTTKHQLLDCSTSLYPSTCLRNLWNGWLISVCTVSTSSHHLQLMELSHIYNLLNTSPYFPHHMYYLHIDCEKYTGLLLKYFFFQLINSRSCEKTLHSLKGRILSKKSRHLLFYRSAYSVVYFQTVI